MNKTISSLLSFGIDFELASQLYNKKYTVSKLKQCGKHELISLGISEKIADDILISDRPPIPEETVNKLLSASAFTCCICKREGLPIVIHHIEEWEKSRSHNIDNLAVLCLNHHGEAHTKHSLSKNLTPTLIKTAQQEWIQEVKERSNAEFNTAFANLKKYKHRWDYFNIKYIYGLLLENNISFSSKYVNYLMDKEYLDKNYIINSDKLTCDSYYWIDFFDGNYIALFIEEILNAIINKIPIKYISNSLYSQEALNELKEGDVCLIDGDFYFKQLQKTTTGQGQFRRARCKINGIQFEGIFDAWFCNSSSAYCNHLTGRKHATQLCLIRNINNENEVTEISCTIIGLGLNLTQPDFLAELIGN